MTRRPTGPEPTSGPSQPWYVAFFDDRYLEVFDPELTAEHTDAEVDGVVALGGLERGMRLLDVACGQGRHAIALARRGLAVTGLDLSPTLLEHARRRADDAGVAVTWLERDMRRPAGTATFDAAVNLFNAFGYLEDESEDQRVLDAVASALVPDGVFVQEYGNREALLRSFRPADVHELEDGTTLLEERDLDLRRSRLHVRYRFLREGRVIAERHHELRLYTLTELVAMHDAVGLHVEAVYGGLDGGDTDLDAPYVVLRSRRTG